MPTHEGRRWKEQRLGGFHGCICRTRSLLSNHHTKIMSFGQNKISRPQYHRGTNAETSRVSLGSSVVREGQNKAHLRKSAEPRGAEICPGRGMYVQKVGRGVMPCSLEGAEAIDTVQQPVQIEQADGKWKYPQLASLAATFIWKKALQGHPLICCLASSPIWVICLLPPPFC